MKMSKVNLLLVILSLLMVFGPTGCNKSDTVSSVKRIELPAAPSRTYNIFEIRLAILEAGISTDKNVLTDTVYILAQKSWLEKEFSEGLAAFQFQFGIDHWSAEENDCDKFADAASFYLKFLNHSSPNRNVNAGLAAGIVYYVVDGRGGHAINMFIVSEDGKLKVAFYEPQRRMFVKLSPTEIASIFFWKI